MIALAITVFLLGFVTGFLACLTVTSGGERSASGSDPAAAWADWERAYVHPSLRPDGPAPRGRAVSAPIDEDDRRAYVHEGVVKFVRVEEEDDAAWPAAPLRRGADLTEHDAAWLAGEAERA